jgi:CBS domain-containing protein
MSLERFTRKSIATITPDAPVAAAAQLMQARHVGAVVVMSRDRPVGLLTDRDLALRIVAERRSPETAVGAVMTADPILAHVRDGIDVALYTMRRTGVRRLPIVNDVGALVGLVALDDLLVLLTGELSTGIEAVIENRGP